MSAFTFMAVRCIQGMTVVSHTADVTMQGGRGGGRGKCVTPMVTAWELLTPAVNAHRARNVTMAGCVLAGTAAMMP